MSAIAVAPIPFHPTSSLSSKSTGSTERHVRTEGFTAGRLDGQDSKLGEDAQLVARCLRGEQGAWDDLIRQYNRRVYGLCYRFTNRDNEAQDLTQEVFLRVFRTLGSFRSGEGCFAVWLTRLTRNLLVDHYRRTKHERVTDALEDKLAVLEERTAQISRTDGLLAGREAGELLQAALQKLSPELREAVILRDLQEMEYREIAQVLQVPEGTVKSRLNRGRAELARVLKRKAGGYAPQERSLNKGGLPAASAGRD